MKSKSLFNIDEFLPNQYDNEEDQLIGEERESYRLNTIGQGAFGIVFRATEKKTNKVSAMKRISKSDDEKLEKKKSYDRELKILEEFKGCE